MAENSMGPERPNIDQARLGGEGQRRYGTPQTPVGTPDAPQPHHRDHKGRNISVTVAAGVAGAGAIIGGWLGLKSGGEGSQQNPDSTAPAGIVSTPTPGFSETSTPPASITVTPEVPTTTPPTEAPIHSSEQGLYASVSEMPLPAEVQAKLEELLEGYEVDIVNNKSVLARENGLDARENCSEIGYPNPKTVPCSSMDGAKLNTADYPNASELMDAVGPAGLDLVAQRDGGAPIIKAYREDTGVVEDIPVTQDPNKVIFLYKYLNAPKQADSKEDIMIVHSQGFGYTYVYHDLGNGYAAIEDRIYGANNIGNEADKNENYMAASTLNSSVGFMALPGLKSTIFDGTAPFAISQATGETVGKKLNAQLYQFTMPNRNITTESAGTINSIFRTNGEYKYNMANGQPFTRHNYK